MKIRILILLIFFYTSGYSQDIFEYEKKIADIEKYDSTEIEFQQTDEKIKFYGTLICPKAEFNKVVVIIPGSGKDTRNSHYVLAEELLKNNIAVFRYDERGVGKSEGKYNTVSYCISDKINDVFSVMNYIRGISFLKDKKIGIIAHSEGGLASIGAIEKGMNVDFLIQWATPVEKHGAFLKYQLQTGTNLQEKNLQFSDLETKLQVMGLIHEIVRENKSDTNELLREKIKISLSEKGYKKKQFEWYISFPASLDLLKKDYEDTYKNLKIPTFYIIGSNDKSVDPISNINLLKSFNNQNIEIRLFNNLNHYLTQDEIKGMNFHLYEIDSLALDQIIIWIKKVQ
ncbi:alpha/beta hydrolase [Flavobacterium sp. EDS]|uniref:serine aminopeptidase domain-containing protein n=1 Tax=Flavobacterium sp. EDS TaxID=2897328 RepID=UPI001E5A4441|nr:alpha/beta hydrolase [Flavobacterium sp. EDS]MCD0474026.1 alpha/beta hydrolase [Flavobacterium sp. EDS]